MEKIARELPWLKLTTMAVKFTGYKGFEYDMDKFEGDPTVFKFKTEFDDFCEIRLPFGWSITDLPEILMLYFRERKSYPNRIEVKKFELDKQVLN